MSFVSRLAVLGLAVAAAAPAIGVAQEREVKFTLDFIALGRHAPWYVAAGKDYFKQEKLNVTIIPSKGTADAIRALESGTSEFAFIDIPSLVAGGGGASSVRIVAVNYQKPPYCVFSLNPGANVTTPKDMVGLEFGSSTASFVPRIHMAFMKMHGLDPSTLRVVNIDGSARVPMLAARKVQAIDLFVMSEPGIRRAVKDAEPKCMLLGDHGLDIYSNSIGVREDFLKQNPEVVRGFVRAALRGWKDALANPEEAARIQVQTLKALDPQIVVEEVKIVRRLAVVPDVEKNGLGTMNRDKMKRTVDFINANVEVQGTKRTVDDIMVEGFLPKDPIRP
ncbi:MAG TPA: ABC transporter substrate-binding protein [Burkholderiales bacterium]|nr:ABC transporter substrate-binding protein [Burkholderiales bacterium]